MLGDRTCRMGRGPSELASGRTETKAAGLACQVIKTGFVYTEYMCNRAGVPEALRGEVWQGLSMASEKMELTIENYRELVTKESPDEKVIFRDIHRTFPAHEFFKVYKDSISVSIM